MSRKYIKLEKASERDVGNEYIEEIYATLPLKLLVKYIFAGLALWGRFPMVVFYVAPEAFIRSVSTRKLLLSRTLTAKTVLFIFFSKNKCEISSEQILAHPPTTTPPIFFHVTCLKILTDRKTP